MSGDLIGQTLGQFRIVAKIGQGGMGIVYRATDERLRRTVALKVLQPGFAADAERRERFLREARAAAAVNHPNIATVYDVGEAGGRVYIAMELVEGESLHAVLDRGAMAIDDALKVARGIARGLAKAHERGLVHRDLKPGNVMVTEDCEVKILDFGLAKDVGLVDASSVATADTQAQVTTDGQVLGTPAYMSPEQAAGKAVDARSDVFSFGVVLHEMLTGTQPFTGSTTMEMLIAIARDAPARASAQNPAVMPLLQAVIDRCLEKSADARYRNARELLAALEPFREEGSTSRPSIEPPASIMAGAPPRRRGGGRSRAWVPALALAAVGALAVVAWRVAGSREGGATPAASDPARADASPAGVAMTAHPPPKTGVPEAAVEYAKALQDVHDGSVALGLQELAHAVVLDPGLAAAHVRLALYRHVYADGVRSYTAARQLRAQLDERDQMLLRAAEPMYARGDLGTSECVPRLQEAVARFPGDAEMYFYLAEHQMIGGQLDGALASIERQLALDPGGAAALFQLADAKSRQGDAPGALDAAKRCMALSPSAASCIRVQALVHKAQGDCTALLADAREEVGIEPQGSVARGQLSDALAATGAAPEALGEALKQYVVTLEPEARAGTEARKRFAAAVIAGDFASAGQALDDVAKAQLTTPVPGEPETPVADWLELLRETGDTKRAGAMAKDFLARLPSYNRASSREDVLPAVEAAVASGDMTRAEATALVRKVLQEETATVGDPRSPEAQRLRRYPYAADAMTTDDEAALRDLLAAYGEPVPAVDLATRLTEPPGQPPWWRGFGKALLVTGDVDAGLPLLETAGRACDVLVRPLDFVRGQYWLGFAREKKGDGTGACEAYQRVLGTWGHAKPRSVTADRARARMKGIGCGG